MQRIIIEFNNNENIGILQPEDIAKVTKIIRALIMSGSLTGVKAGKTIIHFNHLSEFMGIELDYWPWHVKDKG